MLTSFSVTVVPYRRQRGHQITLCGSQPPQRVGQLGSNAAVLVDVRHRSDLLQLRTSSSLRISAGSDVEEPFGRVIALPPEPVYDPRLGG